jgi:CheY-like chemotaxis protein
VLADIDLPRIDGYAFSGRLRQVPSLANTPVILMLSRDDVFDEARAKQAAIADHIAKPFESQELIGKVKKAVAGAPATQPAAAQAQPVAPKPQPAAPAAPPSSPAAQKPAKKAPATDIFDIIDEAPTQEDIKRTAAAADEDAFYEVEPVIEVEEQLPRETAKALPVGDRAVEEMREGLGLGLGGGELSADDEIVSFESLDMATAAAQEYLPPQQQKPMPARREIPKPSMPARPAAAQQPAVTESDIWSMAEATVAKVAKEMLGNMPAARPAAHSELELRGMVEQVIAEHEMEGSGNTAAPQISEEMLQRAVQQSVSGAVRDMAREIIEKVAWEVVPDLAAAMIREEIERLKALQ